MAKRIAILGGGPIGIEAAVRAAQAGFETVVFERGALGSHVARWGHVKFFSPWNLNRSPWGEALLREQGATLADGDDFPTGREYLQQYLQPLVEASGVKVEHLTAVRGVGRKQVLKGDLIGQRADAGRFLIAVSGPDGSRLEEADIVFDATGVYGQPANFGVAGLAPAGEDQVPELIERWVPDVLDRDREDYTNAHVLLVGGGHSASTSLRLLMDLRADAPQTCVTWVLNTDGAPYDIVEGDSLPQRDALAKFGNRAAAGDVEGVTVVRTPVASLERDGVRALVSFADGAQCTVDRIVANVGYRPDTALTRELQVHHCYASEGPMKLAASLLSAAGAGGDCLAQEAPGVDTLRNPETDFWVIGGKSYGRNSNFLLRIGFEQIEAILEDSKSPAA